MSIVTIMAPVLLFAGILTAVIGAATLGSGRAASSRKLREHSTGYGFACLVGGALLALVALGVILAG